MPLRERGAVGLNRLLGETHTGDEMGSVALAIAGVGAVLGAAITVLVRRERRWMPLGADTHRIEAAATRGFAMRVGRLTPITTSPTPRV